MSSAPGSRRSGKTPSGQVAANRKGAKRRCHGARRAERGQAVALFALLIPVTILFMLGVVDYMVTNARVMETVAAADLAAHAGAQSINVLPDGSLEASPAQAKALAAAYFSAQAPPQATLGLVGCGLFQKRPACRVTAQVQSAGWLLPRQWIGVSAIGYLVYGVTEGDQ